MTREPTCPPAREKIAAGRINFQLGEEMLICVTNPLKEEKTTMKIDVAAAVFVGTLST